MATLHSKAVRFYMKLKLWELSLLIALVVTLLWGTLLDQRQQELSDRMIRLHVLAHSDTEIDQMLKYHIRDEVRALVEPLISASPDRESAEAKIRAHLDEIHALASASLAADVPLQATLSRESSPTRAYETFTLPAGFYTTLRIEIGEARGQNWWCVVFPPLCLEAVTSTREFYDLGLDDTEVALITDTGTGADMRFWALERIEDLRERFR